MIEEGGIDINELFAASIRFDELSDAARIVIAVFSVGTGVPRVGAL